jgi:hypothetical protein
VLVPDQVDERFSDLRTYDWCLSQLPPATVDVAAVLSAMVEQVCWRVPGGGGAAA